MAKYYVNKNAQPNGDHEVHKFGCAWLPADQNRIYLGDFSSCEPAVRAAKKALRSSKWVLLLLECLSHAVGERHGNKSSNR